MKIIYTEKAIDSFMEISRYLRKNDVPNSHIRKHLSDIRSGIKNLLSDFPEAGVEVHINLHPCRRIMVKDYNILYKLDDKKQTIQIVLIYKHNLPSLN